MTVSPQKNPQAQPNLTASSTDGETMPLLPIDAQLDLRGTPCPLNFVRTKLKLERMGAGALLEVWLDAGEPIEQVPDSLKMEGYVIEQLIPKEDFFIVQVHKPQA